MDEGQNKLKKPKASDTLDRISSLPDVLVTHILSFVLTKEAVRTSVLSKRWKPLWAYVPVLDLSDSDFPPMGDAFVERQERKANFLTFLHRFLMKNNRPSVRKFHLTCMECCDFSLIKSWICAVKNSHLEELLLCSYMAPTSELPSEDGGSYLSLSYKCLDGLLQQNMSSPTGKIRIFVSDLSDPSILDSLLSLCKEWSVVEELELLGNTGFIWHGIFEFPQRLNTWETLVVLKLHFCLDLDCPKICFPNLKVLHLLGNTFKHDDSASNLINSSCPVLETLNIIRGVVDNLGYLPITSLTLKHLKIYFRNCYDYGLPFETLIDVPALEYLELRDYFTKKYVLGDFGSVVEAKIDVETACAADLLKKIPKVQKLFLRKHVWALEGTKTFGLRGFHYLTYLEFFTRESQDIEWPLILEFLSRSPALEELHFQKMKFVLDEEFDLTLEQDVPCCLLSSLKKCEFGLLDGGETEIEVIGYFLKNSKVLEHMVINSFDRVNVNKQAISALSRGSSKCEIHYRSESFDSMLAKRDGDNSNHITWFS